MRRATMPAIRPRGRRWATWRAVSNATQSLLAGRKRELGIAFDSGMGVGRDLTLTFELGRGRGLGL